MESSSFHPTPYLMIGIILFFLFGSVAYGMYNSFGPGAKGLTDSIDEHARMHELGIAHTHGDN
ncbi:photosystem II reaction center protein PsbN [Prochlorococcus marinus]|nr:photosystem II reaction center protein PsbN [Prochlorococcus marinus]